MSVSTYDVASYNRQTINRLLDRQGGVIQKLSNLSKLERTRQQSRYRSVAGRQIIHPHFPPNIIYSSKHTPETSYNKCLVFGDSTNNLVDEVTL